MHHFENMPDNAKAWVYAANRNLTPEEQEIIHARANTFVTNWTAHQQQLKASFDLLHNLFLVVMADENFNKVSGCGIDKSIHFMKELENELNINLFNRLQVELMRGNDVIVTTKSDVSRLYQQKEINAETPFFNKNITTKKEFDNNFVIPLHQSWIFQSIQKTQLA